MGKIFFMVWVTFNPDHTANLAYMGGHEYASEAACMAIEHRFNEHVFRIMEQTTEEEFPEQEYACTTIAPDHWGDILTVKIDQAGEMWVLDIDHISDETEFAVKAE